MRPVGSHRVPVISVAQSRRWWPAHVVDQLESEVAVDETAT
jgi:hypothetical protein